MLMFYFGLCFLVLILLSRILKSLFLLISLGFIGNNISFLFLFMGYQFGKGNYLPSTYSYWPGYIGIMVLTLIIIAIAGRNSDKPYYDRTIADSGVAFTISSIIGMIIHQIF